MFTSQSAHDFLVIVTRVLAVAIFVILPTWTTLRVRSPAGALCVVAGIPLYIGLTAIYDKLFVDAPVEGAVAALLLLNTVLIITLVGMGMNLMDEISRELTERSPNQNRSQ
ncbi:hypothetical protein [Nocardia sp. CC227C]|uniref:hypothetical protein n=1 Tax=Nocardia sp. CC227C TaxID=3044562 RepID=UPI00278C8930|nr:hypothetical protein [Nocardia sp. CC227C]